MVNSTDHCSTVQGKAHHGSDAVISCLSLVTGSMVLPCPEIEVGIGPQWSLREESSSESERESFAPLRTYQYPAYTPDFGISSLAGTWPVANAVSVLEPMWGSPSTRGLFPLLILSGV